MHYFDWIFVASVAIILFVVAIYIKNYTQSVADFLVANRCAKRYLITVTEGAAAVGIVMTLTIFQMYYNGGLSVVFWSWMTLPIYMGITISGWVVVRFRRTRVLTPVQLFELRYSRNVRVLVGILSFISQILAAGIIPGIAARFFVSFCGLPQMVIVLGLEIPTFALIMVFILSLALMMIFMGGQFVVLVTDAMQGIFCNIVFVVFVVYFFFRVDWSMITESLLNRDPGYSMVNPFDANKIQHFDLGMQMIYAIVAIYSTNTSMNLLSAKNQHEARMGRILNGWRSVGLWQFLLLLPICALAIMEHPDMAEFSQKANQVLSGYDNKEVVSQLTVPIALKMVTPIGLLGAFSAMMLAAFISTADTMLHNLGSVFIQDVILPFRAKPFNPKQHIRLLKVSILGVALFVFIFSIKYNQTQHLAMYTSSVGAIVVGGMGSLTIGALYWKKGTTPAAYAAMIVGAILAITGIVLNQIHEDFIIDGHRFLLLSIIGSVISYIVVSLLTYKEDYNLDKLLHRGKYEIEPENTGSDRGKIAWLYRRLAIDSSFTRSDKIIYFSVFGWSLLWFVVFGCIMTYSLFWRIPEESWVLGWRVYICFGGSVGVLTMFWFTIGGVMDLRALFVDMRAAKRDDADSGMVMGHENMDELVSHELPEV